MTRSEDDSRLGDPDIAGLDALDGQHGPARPLLADEATRLADRVMLRHRTASTVRRPRVSSGRRSPRWLLGAAGVTLATAAAALYGTLTPSRSVPSGATVRQEAPAEPTTREPLEANDTEPAPATPDASPVPSGRPTELLLDHPDGAAGRTARTRAHESRRAADHLARANALRGKRLYREALDRYLYVVSEYPGSLQSRAAQLAAAAIRLEQLRDIHGAEELYQAVLENSDGELAAQAVFGLAEVARARADRSAEASALRELLARHGAHPLAAAARRRLNALEAP